MGAAAEAVTHSSKRQLSFKACATLSSSHNSVKIEHTHNQNFFWFSVLHLPKTFLTLRSIAYESQINFNLEKNILVNSWESSLFFLYKINSVTVNLEYFLMVLICQHVIKCRTKYEQSSGTHTKAPTNTLLQTRQHYIPEDDKGSSLSNPETVAMAAAPFIWLSECNIFTLQAPHPVLSEPWTKRK